MRLMTRFLLVTLMEITMTTGSVTIVMEVFVQNTIASYLLVKHCQIFWSMKVGKMLWFSIKYDSELFLSNLRIIMNIRKSMNWTHGHKIVTENDINEFDFTYFQKRLCLQTKHATKLIGAKQEVSKVYFTVKFFVFTILCKQLKRREKHVCNNRNKNHVSLKIYQISICACWDLPCVRQQGMNTHSFFLYVCTCVRPGLDIMKLDRMQTG